MKKKCKTKKYAEGGMVKPQGNSFIKKYVKKRVKEVHGADVYDEPNKRNLPKTGPRLKPKGSA